MKEDYKFKLFGIDPAVPGGDRSVPPARQEGETPRTDKILLVLNEGRIYKDEGPLVAFVRTLERELSAKQAEVERLNKLLQKRIGERDEKSWRLHKLETLVGPYVQWDEESDYPSFTGELESLKAAQGWRPIETAPKDGTRLLLFYSGNPHNPTKSQFIDVGFYSQWGDDAWDGCWELETGGNRIFPTHWMPLPTPPVEQPPTGEENE